jgi:putative spermidine/putrescine transport system ATP-binding protein
VSAGSLSLRAVTKRFGETVANDGISLDVRPGEFVTFLGPSGSGKTTTLRVIAGFLQPDAGSVVLDEREMTGVPPYKRDIGMVFQNYALFPHMTAAQNVAFPLEMRGIAKAERRRKVKEALDIVHLGRLGGRYPRQLSGGQQQRVALARAIVFNPRLLLMDEPLGALDKKLREALQLEIMRISRQLGVTVVYVTHDQEEALVLSDRIAIYNDGRIEQVGTGEELYERPASLFVADFVGESNIFRGRFEAARDGGAVVANGRRLAVSSAAAARTGVASGSAAALIVRPERLRLGAGANRLAGTVREVIYLGSLRKYVLELEDGTTAQTRVQVGQAGDDLEPGDRVEVGWELEHGIVVTDDAAA